MLTANKKTVMSEKPLQNKGHKQANITSILEYVYWFQETETQ
jgi:hypothetical protein